MKTLQLHTYVCGWCERDFESDSRNHLGASRSGKNVFCSQQCAVAKEVARPAPWRGPCKQCGKMFRSRSRDRMFCSHNCYFASPECVNRLKAYNDQRRIDRGHCLACTNPIPKGRVKYCGNSCRRQYFAERFDRWIANPESIALPQNFDEFLSQTELPCLVDGCSWTGNRLSFHANVVHGISADRLRELGGFNRRTGLVSKDESQKRSAIASQLFAEGKLGHLMPFEKDMSGTSGTNANHVDRLEASEHRRKAQAERRAVLVKRLCEFCSSEYEASSMAHSRRYCSIRCRSKSAIQRNASVAELTCFYCGKSFLGNKYKVDRARKELPVTCSDECRNKLNMRACLIATGKRHRFT